MVGNLTPSIGASLDVRVRKFYRPISLSGWRGTGAVVSAQYDGTVNDPE
jgi:hypothetical protein